MEKEKILRKSQLSKKKVKDAIPGTAGVYAMIAEKCGVNRSSIHRFIHKPANKDILDLIYQEQQKMIDVAENKLMALINKGDKSSIKFFLSTKGKSRGYVEKQEVEHSGTQAIEFTINQPKELEHKELNEIEGGDEVVED